MMLNEKETFKDAMEVALENSKQTGKRYFILFPSIANPGFPKEDVFLTVPVLHEAALESDEINEVAFTVYPTGQVCWGYTKRH